MNSKNFTDFDWPPSLISIFSNKRNQNVSTVREMLINCGDVTRIRPNRHKVIKISVL